MSSSHLQIHRSLFIRAPRSTVWNCIADPEKFFNRIMGAQIEQELASDRTLVADFGEGYKTPIHFLRVEPEHHLSFRWHYEATPIDEPFRFSTSTLVTFELAEVEGGTQLDFLETEFENLPEETRQVSFEQVSLGWPGILDTLGSIAERGGDAWLLVRAGGPIDASPDRVWDLLIRLKFLTHLQSYQGELQPGHIVTLDFGGPEARLDILVVEVAEGHKLSFRWSHEPGQAFKEDQSTLVTLEVVPNKNGSWVAITESEFDRIPEAIRHSTFDQMTEGWKEAIPHLTSQLTSSTEP